MVKATVDTAHHLHMRGHEASVSSAYIDNQNLGCGTPRGIGHTDEHYRSPRYVYIFQPMGTDPRGLLNVYRRNT